jgi:hypothetical protein
MTLMTAQAPAAKTDNSNKSKGAAGRDLGGANTILNGKGVPKSTLGVDGDFYIDVVTFNIYGPKKAGKWGVGVSLRGPQGASGSDGKAGEKGSTGNSSAGAKGDKGDKGERGEKGEKGEPGSPGASGAQGPAGEAGAQGPAGSQGAMGAQGPAGANGINGSKGDTGEKGDRGEKGDQGNQGIPGETGATGLTGPAGISKVEVASIASFAVSNTYGTTSPSSYFGSLETSVSYSFEIIAHGLVPNAMELEKEVGATLVLENSGAVITYSTTVSSGRLLVGADSKYVYFFNFRGTIQNTDSSNRIKIEIKNSSPISGMTVSGTAYFGQVGSIISLGG